MAGHMTPRFPLLERIAAALGVISRKIPKSVCVTAVIVVITYALFETTVTVLYLKDVIEPPASVWLYEESGNTVHFDPVRGYRLTDVPSRITRITRKTVEYVGVLKGNNQGFPDRDDFFPQRGQESAKRFAVFGDSYTAAQFLGQNWPDYVEDITRDSPQRLELLNFSTDGGGLANWWSVLTRLVESEHYEIDGVIFAVIPGNLWRGFSVSDHRGVDHPLFGRMPGWDPETFPRTLEEARRDMRPFTYDSHIVSADEFDRALAMRWRPASNKPVRPYFARKLWQVVRGGIRPACQGVDAPKAFDSFDRRQEWMIRDMARAIRTIGVPAMVIHVPSRENLVQVDPDSPPPIDTELFAALLGARLVDGKRAFSGRSEKDIRSLWLPYDAHWGQEGSNVFGRYVAELLKDWPH
jgi:hypothetical protein